MDEELLRSLQLSIDPAAQVLICCWPNCAMGLSSNVDQVSRHLKRKHNVPNDVRSNIVHLLRHRKTELQNPPDAPLRPDGLPPHPHLMKLDGFACKFCKYRTISKQNRSRHISERHKNIRKQLNVKPAAMFLPWVVCEDGDATRPVGGQEALDHLKDLSRQERQRNQNLVDMAPLNAKPAYPELRPWLERTEWEATYQAIKPRLLRDTQLSNTSPSPSLRRYSGTQHSVVGLSL
ncbi:hypothetical protein QBC36DRAFT_350315 [Triangularia setosa]|uniref:Uncharacterized protein n=1 Tax=Triangularia setosa TaxID=2587417 RepID=A0AAN7A302_9PEZI|nr:hypothetical protein QBC36DRAFT_350315 [Podospora setosa]